MRGRGRKIKHLARPERMGGVAAGDAYLALQRDKQNMLCIRAGRGFLARNVLVHDIEPAEPGREIFAFAHLLILILAGFGLQL
jgi:hypothetical protein